VAVGHAGLGSGIILDLTDADSATVISGNVITEVYVGMHLWAGFGDAVVTGNRIIDPVSTGIKCEPDSAETQAVLLEGNSFALTAQNAAGRTVLVLSPSGGAGTADYRVIGNSIVYDAATDGGVGGELAILCATDNTTIIGNFIDGGGMDFGGVPPEIRTDGSTPTNVQLIGNTLIGGARMNTLWMDHPITLGNNVDGYGWAGWLGFFDKTNESVQKPEVTTARDEPEGALHDLLAALAALGLITDSSTAT
jgi:hypothetical protein